MKPESWIGNDCTLDMYQGLLYYERDIMIAFNFTGHNVVSDTNPS
jgi:hypothetical protein